ncbi:Sulfide-quinone reductase [Hyella patelloides LEGE 07179]|uniref:Sulfide-quinone reductase n=1 Tax=Hyella patelloides LEGE 07179 TaxID=945734 RepID=A0A563VNR8_9CYAN|nr:FAD-dependent oxidoreductase [Hyella patelloides]VEP13068.1 Sulfide-quinone reductase [Hyella patelloides LEGE 07179]
MANVVVIGGGLGGLPTAYELRYYLSKEHTVTLISDKPQFTFIPGLIRVALNLNPLEHIQLDLSQLAQWHGIEWISGKVTALNPQTKEITVEDNQTINYDYLAIATGASLAFEEIPGLGPHGGYTQSVCTPDHALQARSAWLEFLENPGSLVVGAMSGAGCFGPAYEFVLMADWELRRHRIRDKVDITYLTPEPYIGHMGVGGVKNAQELTQELMAQRGIKAIANTRITHIDAQNISLADGRQFPFKYAMILPSFRGVEFLREVPELTNEKGFIPVLPSQRHPDFPAIYALGVGVHLEQPEKTPVSIGLPKSGQMTEAMGVAVAHNIAVELGAIRSPLTKPTLEALCFAEYGNTGIAYIAAPVLPDPVTGKRRYSYAVRGRWVNWVKAAFEEYFLLKMRFGLGMPWFEKLGLRLLFGLSMLKSLKTFEADNRQITEKNPEVIKS